MISGPDLRIDAAKRSKQEQSLQPKGVRHCAAAEECRMGRDFGRRSRPWLREREGPAAQRREGKHRRCAPVRSPCPQAESAAEYGPCPQAESAAGIRSLPEGRLGRGIRSLPAGRLGRGNASLPEGRLGRGNASLPEGRLGRGNTAPCPQAAFAQRIPRRQPSPRESPAGRVGRRAETISCGSAAR